MNSVAMRFDYCTSLALGGIAKLLALLYSLERHHRNAYVVWVLCESKDVEEALERLELKNLKLVLFEDFEKDQPELIAVKPHRDPFEYNCTLRPAWIRYVLEREEEIECVTYVDTDLYFFSDPAPLYEQFRNASVLLTPHRLSSLSKRLGINTDVVGNFNAGWVAFKKDSASRKLLDWWHDRCVEWCFRIPTVGRFGEQKYLDAFPVISTQVAVVEHLGANVAPWNMNDFHFVSQDDDGLLVEDQRLVFFHFHALKIEGESSFKVEREIGKTAMQLTNPSYVLPRKVERLVYRPYLKDLRYALSELSAHGISGPQMIADKSLIDYFNKKTKTVLIVWWAHAVYFYLGFTKLLSDVFRPAK
jgi:hypothetical protein